MEIDNFNFDQNYFDLFGLPASCELDEATLRESFMSMQRQYHPDRFAAASDAVRRRAVQIASHINSAHQTLQVPLHRAEYCLKLAGLDTDVETDTKMDPMFLMQQMELRESLEDVSSSAKPFDALDDVRDEIDGLVHTTSKEAAALLADEKFDEARDCVRRWQFLEKLASEANSLEAQLDEA